MYFQMTAQFVSPESYTTSAMCMLVSSSGEFSGNMPPNKTAVLHFWHFFPKT